MVRDSYRCLIKGALSTMTIFFSRIFILSASGTLLFSSETSEQIREKDILIGTEIFKRPGQ
jgi:hypothetical protein